MPCPARACAAQVGAELERPFGTSSNDLPLLKFGVDLCRNLDTLVRIKARSIQARLETDKTQQEWLKAEDAHASEAAKVEEEPHHRSSAFMGGGGCFPNGSSTPPGSPADNLSGATTSGKSGFNPLSELFMFSSGGLAGKAASPPAKRRTTVGCNSPSAARSGFCSR